VQKMRAGRFNHARWARALADSLPLLQGGGADKFQLPRKAKEETSPETRNNPKKRGAVKKKFITSGGGKRGGA